MNKTEFYADLNRDFKALMAGETSFLATLANTSALLFERLSDVNWAGFYLLEGETLVLGPFQGKLAEYLSFLDDLFYDLVTFLIYKPDLDIPVFEEIQFVQVM